MPDINENGRLTIGFDPDVRAALAVSARENGRPSLAAEVAFRVRKSFSASELKEAVARKDQIDAGDRIAAKTAKAKTKAKAKKG
jgi:hypothetical protein